MEPGARVDRPGSTMTTSERSNLSWDFDNPLEAALKASLVEWYRRQAQLIDVNIEEHVAKLTSEHPNAINYGHSHITDGFLEYEFNEWSKRRRCGTVEAKKEYLMGEGGNRNGQTRVYGQDARGQPTTAI